MNNSRLHYLFKKYFDKTASQEERAELAALLQDNVYKKEALQLFSTAWESYQAGENLIPTEKAEDMLNQILGKKSAAPVHKFNWRRMAAAAAVLFFLLGGYLLITNKKSAEPPVANNTVNDVRPGSFKARLTLADGSTITLDSAATGLLTKQGNTTVFNKDGQLIYNGNSSELLYNTLSTAKAETYSTVLADGSKVWLNAASSIKFPVAFIGNERRVEITGEAYFEVAKNPSKPFHVTVNGMDVEVLGTHFNINSYDDEAAVKTTLLEGAVTVRKNKNTLVLSPGEQAQLSKAGEIKKIAGADTEEAVAWVFGQFRFENTDVETMMRQIARWYDVDVMYEGAVTKKFGGKLPRTMTAATVFKVLEETGGVHFTIKGKKVIVKP